MLLQAAQNMIEARQGASAEDSSVDITISLQDPPYSLTSQEASKLTLPAFTTLWTVRSFQQSVFTVRPTCSCSQHAGNTVHLLSYLQKCMRLSCRQSISRLRDMAEIACHADNL